MPVAASRGSPMVVAARRVESAFATTSAIASGTISRRVAVHFCPAFAVISRCASVTKRSNSGDPSPASAPRIDAFRLSCSAVNRVPARSRRGFERNVNAVSADPVNATTSCPPSRSSMSPREPATSCTAPSGRMPDSTTSRKHASVT